MNISKRIVTVLMCIAMLLSMSTSFAFALGNDAATEETVTDLQQNVMTPAIESVDENETLVGDSTVSVGANPTTNVTITVDDNTIIIDSTAAEGVEYTPSFADVDFGEKTFTYGTNLFASLADATTAEAIASGAAVLIKSTTETTLSIKAAANYYGEAYNMLPYVVGTKEDGSDWTKNTAFFDKALVIDQIEVYNMNSASINIYGFILKTALNAGWKHTNFTLTLENFAIQKTDSTSPFFNMYNSGYTSSGDTNTLILKNCYPDGENWPGSARVFNSAFPTNLILDGWFVDETKCPGVVSGTSYLYQIGTNPADPSKSTAKIEIKNSNFQNLTQSFLDAHEGVNKLDVVEGQVAEVIFTNNTVNSFTGAAVMQFQGRKYTGINFSNNYVKANGSAYAFRSSYDSTSGSATQPFDITVENNKLININSNAFFMTDSEINATVRTLGNVSVKNNYAAATDGASGNAIVSTTNSVTSSNYYVDSTMTVLNTDLAFTADSEAGTVVTDDSSKLIYSIDDIAIKDITVTVSENATATFYSDAACTNAIADIDAYTDDIAYLKVAAKSNAACALVYKVEIVKSISTFVDPHNMIDTSKAVMLTNEISDASDGDVVIVS